MRDRLRCLIGRPDYPDWPAWVHAGRGRYYRQRWCRRCGQEDLETDDTTRRQQHPKADTDA